MIAPAGASARAASAVRVAVRLGFRRQPRPGRPQHPRGGDRLQIKVTRGDHQVRSHRLAIEQQREMIGRVDLAERHRRAQPRAHTDEPVVDADLSHRHAQILAEGVIADPGDDRAADAEPRRSDCHVRRAATQRLGEGPHVGERDAGLLGVQIDADPPHRDQVECLHRGHSSRHAEAVGWGGLTAVTSRRGG